MRPGHTPSFLDHSGVLGALDSDPGVSLALNAPANFCPGSAVRRAIKGQTPTENSEKPATQGAHAFRLARRNKLEQSKTKPILSR